MKNWHAAVLGAVQGLTEFLPVSSTAHIHLVNRLAKWQSPGMVLDTSLHLGTLAATLVWAVKEQHEHELLNLPLLTRLAVATLPAALAGLFLEKWIEQRLSQAWISALMLILGGGLFLWIDSPGPHPASLALSEMSYAQAWAIGMAQMLALIPGLSRSGLTMAAALGLGVQRQAALRFSFLLSIPVVAGSGLFKLKDLAQHAPELKQNLWVGGSMAALSGYLCLAGLLKYFEAGALRRFGFYRMALGAALLSFQYFEKTQVLTNKAQV